MMDIVGESAFLVSLVLVGGCWFAALLFVQANQQEELSPQADDEEVQRL